MVEVLGTAEALGAGAADDDGHSEETSTDRRWIDRDVKVRWLELPTLSSRQGLWGRFGGEKRLLVLGLTLDLIST
jgi:hypothetical protein